MGSLMRRGVFFDPTGRPLVYFNRRMVHKNRFSFRNFNEFTVLVVFGVVGLGMLLFGGIFGLRDLDLGASEKRVVAPAVVAPTTEAYQKETRDVMTPFLRQAANVQVQNFSADIPSMLELVTKTQELMLRVRVPKDSREAHLSFVLLLDQWKRALAGSKSDQAAVLAKTPELVAAHSWVMQK